MLTYDLEARGGLSLYDYLTRCIKGDILAGTLRPGEKLPSKRALARHLEVSVSTVETAYAQLEAEGYVYAQEKRGYFVTALEGAEPPPPAAHPSIQLPQEEPEHWLLDFKGDGAGTEGFPFTVWARLMRRVLSEEGEKLLRPLPHNGVRPLREAIAGYLRQFRGMAVEGEQIVVGAGAEYLYNLIVQLLGRDCVYGVETPGYPKSERVYTLNGARCVPLPLDRHGVSAECAQASGAQVLHLSPSHQFPSGVVTPIARRQSLLRWAAAEPGRFIIEDDYDSEFRFRGRPIPTLQSIDRWDRVLYLNTFNRTLAPSLRIGYLVLPPALLPRYREKLGFYSCTVPAMEQYTLARFLSEGGFESHMNRMRVFYRARRERLLAALDASSLAGRCRVRGVDAGLHFLLELDTQWDDETLAARAREAGIRLSFLSEYGGGEAHCLVVRDPVGELDHWAEALERLAGLL
ncbi:MAG TPA: PLP-dependent aminotransferase family protein [Candidatus Flavonifractor merdigallinarum]|uniref:PLP-dependent aminotransferase family protein n=1 Tax=Candidatus Flavonifractor merdigallinarum TaxID=2838589 RepID=A0A9D1Y9W5_9FIRM|nr:PLP-dependent aminotransferase family protein [Candidatus Flavonifractor merdigallinarum]